MTKQLFPLLALTVLAAAGPAHGAIIFQRLGDISYQCCPGAAVAFTWTQPNTWTDVRIDIPVYHNDSAGVLRTGVLYLTNSLGPGTTQLANEIDESILQSTTPGESILTAFTGLTLGPGTYHLIYHPVGGGYWDQLLVTFNALSPLTTAPGVTEGFYGIEDINAPYRPASTFVPLYYGMRVSITGTPEPAAVPEPASGLLAFGALVWIFQRRR